MASYAITPQLFTSRMNILIYGDPGSGKTHLAGSAQDHPDMANVHVFNIDGGIMTLADRGDIRASDISSLDQLEQELYKLAARDKEYEGVKTVVIDNVTELQTLNLEAIIRGALAKGRKNATLDDVWVDDYGVSGKQLARILRGFRDLPLNKVYIAHKMDKMRKGTQVIEESRPKLTAQLCTAVTGYMDFVWHLYVSTLPVPDGTGGSTLETHRYLLTQPYNNFMAKTRGTRFAEALGTVVQDPSLAQIYETYLVANGLRK